MPDRLSPIEMPAAVVMTLFSCTALSGSHWLLAVLRSACAFDSARRVSDRSALGDQARTALPGQVRPQPLPLDAQSVLQLRQKHQVDERPDEPCGKPAEPNSVGFKNGKVLADHGHVALVKVPEGAGGRAASP